MEQRSQEWYLARKGRITASECYVLLANHKESMTDEELAVYKAANPKSRLTTKDVPFSEGTYTYLNKKVAEYYMPDNNFLEYVEMNQLHSKAIEHGQFWEADARQRYMDATGYEVYEVGFIEFDGFEQFCGGSPDGVVRHMDGIIEIKCPLNPEVHQDYLLMESPEELKELKPQYYAQIQMNIMVTGSVFGDFVSFDPRTSPSKQLKVLRCPKDEEMCKMLSERVALAKDYYRERMSKLEKIEKIII